jgi:hypothetical protein
VRNGAGRGFWYWLRGLGKGINSALVHGASGLERELEHQYGEEMAGTGLGDQHTGGEAVPACAWCFESAGGTAEAAEVVSAQNQPIIAVCLYVYVRFRKLTW